MTSQQMTDRLHTAIAIISECERYLEEIDYAASGWDGVSLHRRVAEFMDLHRDEHMGGGAE